MLLSAARARKHQILTSACTLEFTLTNIDPAETPTEVLRPAVARVSGRRDEDPVAVTLAREQLQAVIGRLGSLSELERRAVALAASDYTHREIAARLGVGARAVNNALQRARHKLGDAVAGSVDRGRSIDCSAAEPGRQAAA